MKNKTEDNPTTRTDYRRRRSRTAYLSILLFVLCHVSAVIGLTACADDIAPTDEPLAGNPVELTTQVAGHVRSRATADNTWDGGEEVGVQLDGTCYKYIADASGKLTVAPGQEIPRWSSPNDKKTVVAWYPYSDKLPETFTMEKGQSADENYYKSDFLLAKETEVAFGNPEITFRHLPAKVVVNVKIGDGVTEADVSDLSKLKVSIHNHFSDGWGGKNIYFGQDKPQRRNGGTPSCRNTQRQPVYECIAPPRLRFHKKFPGIACAAGTHQRRTVPQSLHHSKGLVLLYAPKRRRA